VQRRRSAFALPSSLAQGSIGAAGKDGAEIVGTGAPGRLAQTAPVATLCGTVFDSLFTSRPLAGAEVFLDGTPRSAVTDSLGRFVSMG